MVAVETFMERIRAGGGRPALRDGEQEWTYARLSTEVERWSDRLQAAGARRAAFRLRNGLNWVALDLALMRLGLPAIPLPEFFSSDQQAHVLDSSGADLYLTDADGTPGGFRYHDSIDGVQLWRRPVANVPDLHSGTAKLTFTSGSTGRPKGVCLSAAHLLATAHGLQQSLASGFVARHLCVLPLSLLLENVAGIYANLLNHSEIVVPPLTTLGLGGSSSLDMRAFADAQHTYQPESLILVPQLLLALTLAGEAGMTLPESYRLVAVGGGKVAPQLIDRATRVGIPVFEGYGLTECGSVVALNVPGDARKRSVGKPLPHIRITLRDDEIYVRGANMLGYLGEARASAEWATGDLGSWDDSGFLHVHGRKKSGFITAFGRNVNPEWMESELQSEIAIAHALVFGEGLPQNVALIVPQGSPDTAAVQSAIDAANQRLPDYARVTRWLMIPGATFQAAGCLTDNGRPRRSHVAQHFSRELRSLHQQVETRNHAAF